MSALSTAKCGWYANVIFGLRAIRGHDDMIEKLKKEAILLYGTDLFNAQMQEIEAAIDAAVKQARGVKP